MTRVQTPWRRERWRRCGALFLTCAAALYAPLLLVHGACLTGWGLWSIPGVEFLFLVTLLPIPVLAGSLVGLCFPRSRSASACAAAVSGGMVVLLPVVMSAACALRTYGFRLAGERAAPLIAAIERFDREHGRPPRDLEELVPHYLSRLPSGTPRLQIVTGVKAERDYHGNRWVLYANVQDGIIDFDTFLFFPNGRYPERGYGGGIERIGAWAYVHD